MANLKSSKKRAVQIKKQQARNKTRASDVKTVTKKFLAAVDAKDLTLAQELMQQVESKIARAKGKKLFKANTAARKVGVMAKKLSALQKKSA